MPFRKVESALTEHFMTACSRAEISDDSLRIRVEPEEAVSGQHRERPPQ